MGLTRKQCEMLGIGHLYPSRPSKGGKRRGAAHVRGVMNRTEGRFAAILEMQRLFGEIKGWSFEPETLVLGPKLTFTPDFKVEELDGSLTWYDVKGKHVWEDSVVKAKAAAVIFPQYRFAQVRWNGSEWKSRFFSSGKGDTP